ncbi:MAG: cobalt transporter CbiM [Gemmataceae bacterium]|nr:cobalt transporter CbiM [Planctomycetia bacterium]MBX3399668.1 cobalt transporter CbiM [Gemmataceae bacterium]
MDLFAVHLADGVLAWPWLTGGGAVALALLAAARGPINDDEIPRIGILTGALFVASQLHLPVAIGSVHLLLNAIAGILLGRFVGIALLVALGFQALLFGHGGLTTLGLNVAVMGVPAILAALLFVLARRAIRRSPSRAGGVGAAIGAATSALTVALNGSVIWLGLENGGREAALAVMLLHLPVIGVEAVGTGVIVAYLAKVKPEWLKLPVDQSSTGVISSNGTSH